MRAEKTNHTLLLPLCLTVVVLSLVLGTALSHPREEQTVDETMSAFAEIDTQIPEEPAQSEEPPLTLETLPALPFTDIAAEAAYGDVLRYTTYYGYLSGVTEESFAPLTIASRAAVITALHRVSGETAPAYDGRFADVTAGCWYEDAVAWGVSAGIITGVTEDSFAPMQSVTRSQLAEMLLRFCEYSGVAETERADVLPGTEPSQELTEEEETIRIVIREDELPDMPVSRWQLAEALVALCAVQGDELAAEILAALPEETEPVSSLDHDAAQLIVDQAAEKYGAIGVQVAVIENGAVTDTFAYGWATRGTEPMTADHKLRIASISKVAVGMAAMILCEDGVVDLDESIGTYWGIDTVNPYHRDTPITIRTILTHTSSIINAGDDVSRSYSSVRSKLASGYYNGLTPGAAESWSYNNYAFGVLGMTLELAADSYLTDVLRERLFTAMDIDAAFYAGEVEDTTLLATLYRHGGEVALSVEQQKNMKNPATPGASGSPFAGGLAISASDLGKLVVLLTGDGVYEGVQLMDAESIATMETVFPVSDGSSQGIPLRWRSNLYGRDEIYYHTGSAYGVYNCMSYDPATGDGVVVLTTGALGSKDENNIYCICSEIAAYLYAQMEET